MYISKILNMHDGDITLDDMYIALGFSNPVVIQE